ncbi:hypothetical protein GCM10009804_69610 [Kribbella hippodromi]|uniref:Uncharacterized protein n=1 Tax=Kribbella hippodromi TaxID=434347 RepID=A0ABP4Q7X5_9ACTN
MDSQLHVVAHAKDQAEGCSVLLAGLAGPGKNGERTAMVVRLAALKPGGSAGEHSRRARDSSPAVTKVISVNVAEDVTRDAVDRLGFLFGEHDEE